MTDSLPPLQFDSSLLPHKSELCSICCCLQSTGLHPHSPQQWIFLPCQTSRCLFRKSILFFFLHWDCQDKSLLTGHEAAWKEHIVPKSWFGFPVTTQCHHPSFNYKSKIVLWIFFFVLFYLIFYSTTISWMNRNDTGLHPLSLSLHQQGPRNFILS